jgi:hypothetical protein
MVESLRIRWEGLGRMRNVYTILAVKSDGKRPLGKPKRRWKVNVKTDVRVWTGFKWLRIGSRGGPLWKQY